MSLSLLLPVLLPRWSARQQEVQLEGYQMHAVDNWILDRNPVPILIVHTGNTAHKITVFALSPPSQEDWELVLTSLKRHAKPKETAHGTLFVTSLAQFRSDYTIVQLPGGNLVSAKQQLYTNINLLRMGMSGRSGLTLEESSDATKDRFISTYFLPDDHEKTLALFNDTVLEFVKLIQASLYIFGYFAPSAFDGLLCNYTVQGFGRWVKEVGLELVEGLEPMERIADPSAVTSLLSLVLAVRNRLVGLSGSTHIPKDPFFHPRLFIRAVASYSTNSHSSHSLLSSPLMVSKSSSHSPRQSVSHSSHGDSPSIPTPSIPALPKDHLTQANGSEFIRTYTHSLPVVPTIHIPATSSPNSPTNPSSTSRVRSSTLSSEALSGASNPKLALTIPTPSPSGFHKPVPVSQTSSTSPVETTVDNPVSEVFLTRSLVESVFSAYDMKLLKSSPEVRRAVRKEQRGNKDEGSAKDGLSSIVGLPSVAPRSHLLPGDSLPGLLTGTLASSLTGGSTHSGAASILMPMTDLEEFIELVVGHGSSYMRRSKAEKKEKEREKAKEKEERKERESRRERDGKEAHYLSSASSSDGLVDFSKAARRMKAKVKGRSVDKLRDFKVDNKETTEGRDSQKGQRKDKADGVDGVGGLISGLWTGKVSQIVRMRNRMEESERERLSDVAEREGARSDGLGPWRGHRKSRPSIWSDGETDSHPYVYDSARAGKRVSLPARQKIPPSFSRRSSITGTGQRSKSGSTQSIPFVEKSDGRSTEEEGFGLLGTETFGSLWAKSGSRVRDKLGTWSGLSKLDNKLSKHRLARDGATLVAHPESNIVDLSPTPSPVGSPSSPNFVPGILSSPTYPPTSSAAERSLGRRLIMPSLVPVSPSLSQLHSQPHSPVWNPDDDDDLLSSGQVSPVGYGSSFGFDSGTEDPRTPKAWPSDYLARKLVQSQLGSSFSVSRASIESSTDNSPQKRGSQASAHTHSTKIVESLGRHPTRRPWLESRIPHASRVSSWADPVSARDDAQDINTRNSSEGNISDEDQESEDRLGKDEELNIDTLSQHHRRTSTARPTNVDPSSSTWSNEGITRHRSPNRSAIGIARIQDSGSQPKPKSYHLEDEEGSTSKMLGMVPKRRRSFHSLSIYRHKMDEETDSVDHRISIKVLPIDRMRIDVELCGYYLIMGRRAEHLQNVLATLQILTSRLSETNTHMREHYNTHLLDFSELEARLKTIAEVDMENANTMKISQATKSLWYEAEQFRVPDLWHIASPPRQKVLAMREKVSGTGGRRLPRGVHGAHGRFNRLQWTLDGQERLVDSEGKTESEVEEESRIDPESVFINPPKEDVEDVVENPSIKPMWLLRFFTSWGANWGASAPSADAKDDDVKAESPNSPSWSRDKSEETRALTEPIKVAEKAVSL